MERHGSNVAREAPEWSKPLLAPDGLYLKKCTLTQLPDKTFCYHLKLDLRYLDGTPVPNSGATMARSTLKDEIRRRILERTWKNLYVLGLVHSPERPSTRT